MPSPITLAPELDSYHAVEMGPIPGKPPWHEQSNPSRFPFPTLDAATRFAQRHFELEPEREIVIRYPDGRGWDGKKWVG